MKVTKRILCLALALLMLLSMLIACKKKDPNAGDTGTPGETSDTTPTEAPTETDEYGQIVYQDPTAGLNFNGKSIHFLIREGDQYKREWFNEEPGDSLEQYIHYRNLAVAEELNVTIDWIIQAEGEKNAEFTKKITNVGNSGMGGIDVVSNFAAYATNQTIMGYYVNWYNKEKLPYLNLDKNYWNQDFIRDAEAFDRLFVCVGDMNLSVYDRCMVVFFNPTEAAARLKDANGNAINLYALAQSGEWYYETFYNMIKDVYVDNGTTQGTRDNKDFYGVTGIKGSEASDAFLYSLGGALTQTDVNDGSHSLVTETGLAKLETIFGKMDEFWYSTGATMPTSSSANYDVFTGGHAMFMVDVVWHYDDGLTKLNNMSSGYGILPMPKLDENQTEYLTGVQDAHNVLSIMMGGMTQDLGMVSAVLEKMAFESYETVRPYYVEKMLKKQQMNADSEACFNLVLNGITWDFADVYATSLSGLRSKLWRGPFQRQESFTTNWGNNKDTYGTYLTNLDTWLIAKY